LSAPTVKVRKLHPATMMALSCLPLFCNFTWKSSHSNWNWSGV